MHAALTLPQQYLFLSRNPICAGTGDLSATHLRWEYRVRPTPLSRAYTVCTVCQRGSTPDAFVLSPDLQGLAKERALPHVYHNPTRLCLHLPRANEWDASMRIDQTYVPWVAVWLYYFEEWLESNDWKGGGEHPAPESAPRYNRRVRRALR